MKKMSRQRLPQCQMLQCFNVDGMGNYRACLGFTWSDIKRNDKTSVGKANYMG